jgi:hypothetical protein
METQPPLAKENSLYSLPNELLTYLFNFLVQESVIHLSSSSRLLLDIYHAWFFDKKRLQDKNFNITIFLPIAEMIPPAMDKVHWQYCKLGNTYRKLYRSATTLFNDNSKDNSRITGFYRVKMSFFNIITKANNIPGFDITQKKYTLPISFNEQDIISYRPKKGTEIRNPFYNDKNSSARAYPSALL